MNIDPLRVSHTLKELKGIPRTDFRPQYKPLPLEGFPLVDFVNGLSEQQKQLVGSLGHIEYYESNTIIFKEGEEASKFYLIEEGQVSVESRLVEGMRFPIHVASLGQTFGWSALVRPYL
jgi:CRP-like cAMP-binding protein